MLSSVKLKHEMLKLLKEDLEFRYAVAGFIGLDEILKRLDKHEEILVKHSKELVKLREDMNKGFLRHDAEIAKLREDLVKLREDMNKGFLRHDEELVKLRADMVKGFQLLEMRTSALGARWGLLSEEAFREGLKGILEKNFKVKVERWISYDKEGFVYGYPNPVEVDIAIHNEKIFLIEVASHIKSSDVTIFKRKAEFYEKTTGKKLDKLMIVTPFIEEKAKEACLKHNIEFYTKTE